MELRHLRYFVQVAGEENVTRAAERLHVSQPALSRQIRDLEDELGFLLLERSAKAVRLTAAGRVFLAESRAVLQRVEEAVKNARTASSGGAGGEIHAGYSPSLTVRLLPPTLRTFQASFPKVRVRLHDLTTDEMLAQLRKKKLQIAFTVKPSKTLLRGFEFEELTRDCLRIGVAPRHPFAKKRSVTLAKIVREPLLGYTREDYPGYYEALGELFRPTRAKPKFVEEHDGINSMIAAVESGAGIAILPDSAACMSGPRIKLVPITPNPEPLVIGAIWLAGNLGETGNELLKCSREAAKGLLKGSKPWRGKPAGLPRF